MKKEIIFEAKLIVGECIPETLSSTATTIDLSDIDAERFSSLQKLLRTTAWILRYADRFLKKQINSGPLTAIEIKKAKELYTQAKCFSDATRRIKRVQLKATT